MFFQSKDSTTLFKANPKTKKSVDLDAKPI